MKKVGLLLLFFGLLMSCKNESSQSYGTGSFFGYESSSEDGYGYEDGIYCATVEYYYSETGTNSTYTLEVEIEDNELVKIYWSNGGWLDESHFYAPDISNGYANFESDKGVEYTVEIIGEEGDCYTDSDAPSSEDDFEEEQEEEQGYYEEDYYEEENEEDWEEE